MGQVQRWSGWLAVGSLCTSMAWVAPTWASLASQPSNKHSTIVANSGDDIRDSDFAAMMKGLLIDSNGNSTVKDAKFFFQTCYGGGMLDDLVTALGDSVKWVGGSASRHDEVSWGENDAITGSGDFWSLALVPELAKNQTVKQAIDNADNNPWETRYRVTETGQSIFGDAPDSDQIKLKDPQTKSFHAILWAGIPDGNRHFNDIVSMQNMLINQMQPHVGAAKFSITTLFGNGSTDKFGDPLPFTAQAATKANLQTAINSLKNVLGPDEQFFFYATDHGGLIEEPIKPVQPVTVPTGSVREVKIELTEQEKSSITGYVPAQPRIVIDFIFEGLPTGQMATAEVSICFPDEPMTTQPRIVLGTLWQFETVGEDRGTTPGGVILPPINSGSDTPSAPITPQQTFSLFPYLSDIDLSNLTICIENNSSHNLIINNFYFYSGPIGGSTLIPEPATFSFLVLGGLLLSQRRNKAA